MVKHPTSTFAFRKLIGAALVAVAITQASGASAQAVPPGLSEARKAWAAAVQKSDGAAAAALALLPLQYEGYQAPRTQTRAAYLREVPHWSSLKACLATEKLERVKTRSRLGTWSFNCDGHGFFFAERDGKWRHTGYENSNE